MNERPTPAPPTTAPAAALPSPATAFAVELLHGFRARGLTDIVVAPGARSQALALAAARMEQRGEIRLHVRIDERDAGFFALGLGRELGRPALVITTSGSAVGNLLPAVMEAHHAGVPLLIASADRPEELRGIRSNQTTQQPGIFTSFVRFDLDVAAPEPEQDHRARAAALAEDAWAAALGGASAAEQLAGPAHLNLQFREPLSGLLPEVLPETLHADAATEPSESGAKTIPDPLSELSQLSEHSQPSELYHHSGDALAVVIAGAGAGPDAERFAYESGLPLIAEVVSGARFGRQAIVHYRELLDDPEYGGAIEHAIVFGQPSLSRQVPALLTRAGVRVTVVHPGGGDRYNPGRQVDDFVAGAGIADGYDPRVLRPWLGAWVVRDRELTAQGSSQHVPDTQAAVETGYKERSRYARAEVAAMREPVTREMLCETLWLGTWPHDRLVLGASRLIRVLDSLAPSRKVTVHSNRGLAGIDGTVATALGVAVGQQTQEPPEKAAGATRVLLGDLTLLHDVGGLLLGAGELRPRVQLIVGNDGGGTIFDSLEVAESADPDAYTRVMRTPHEVNLRALAEAYGWEYQLARTRAELERALTAPVLGPCILEVPLAS